MIKEISKLSEKGFKYQKEFLMNCDVYEKISSFYFHIKVQSKNILRFYKSNNKEIEPVDIILNKMWEIPINDFTRMFFSDEDFISQSIGLTFSFFFFPVSNPLGIAYDMSKEKYRYILDNVKLANGKIVKPGYLSQFEKIDTEHLIRKHGVYLGGLKLENKKVKDFIKDKSKLIDYILNENNTLTREDNLCSLEKNASEGFILKYKEDVYQVLTSALKSKITSVNDNRLALEIFTHSFINFINSVNYFDFLTATNYIKNVCALTLKYKTWLEQNPERNLFKFYNIEAKNLAAPTFGFYPGTYFEMIPNVALSKLCKENELWNNIFKILLNGLRREKKKFSNSLITTDDDVQTWNELVKILTDFNSVKAFQKMKEK